MIKLDYPIYFTKNICVHCGAENQLYFLDSRGNYSKRPIYPIIKIVCKNCGKEYFPRWIPEEDGSMRPVCCSKDIEIPKFEQSIIEYTLNNRRDIT